MHIQPTITLHKSTSGHKCSFGTNVIISRFCAGNGFFGERLVGSEKVDLIFFRLPNPPNLLNPTPPQPTDAFHSLTHLFLSFFQNFVSSVFHISMISLDFCFFRIWNFRFKIPTTWLILNCSSQHLFKFSDVSYFQATIYNIFLRSWHLWKISGQVLIWFDTRQHHLFFHVSRRAHTFQTCEGAKRWANSGLDLSCFGERISENFFVVTVSFWCVSKFSIASWNEV